VPIHVTTLIYAQQGDKVAMLRRLKEPNLGLWSPPGGKVEPGESPLDSAVRELAEETGLEAWSARLAAVVTEHDPRTDERWVMFVFHALEVVGELIGGTREGVARWVAIGDLPRLSCPPADPHIAAAVLRESPGIAYVNVVFDLEGRPAITTTRDITA